MLSALLMTGFCVEEVKPLGPVQLYEAPLMLFAESVRSVPEQTGELLLTAGGASDCTIVTVSFDEALVQPSAETASEYTPAFAVVMLFIEIKRLSEINPFGPVQE